MEDESRSGRLGQEDCLNCRYANWSKTRAGRLHPSGDGRCSFAWLPPPVPKAFYWLGYGTSPKPSGGMIDRRKPHGGCPCHQLLQAERSEGGSPTNNL